jgi:hypothetical protein
MNPHDTHNEIRLFEQHKVRSVWDEDAQKWWFSIVDIIAILTESENPRHYWTVLKGRLATEGNETVTNCEQLKMLSPDGKMRLTDVVDTEQVLRLTQSVPSKKAEPFKLWLAKVGSERIDEAIDPELSIDRAIQNYRPDGMRSRRSGERTRLSCGLGRLAQAFAAEPNCVRRDARALWTAQKFSATFNFIESVKIAVSGAEVAKDARKSLESRGGEVISLKNARQLALIA